MNVDAAVLAAAGGLLTASALAVQQFVAFLRERRETRDSDDVRPSKIDSAIAASADAAVVVLSKTVETLQDENARLVHRVQEMENALQARDLKIQSLEDRLRRAEVELRAVADELSDLKNH